MTDLVHQNSIWASRLVVKLSIELGHEPKKSTKTGWKSGSQSATMSVHLWCENKADTHTGIRI